MPEDEKQQDGAEETTVEGNDDGASNEDDQHQKQDDYRAKLNATNRFLKKEGYEFDQQANEWKKKAEKPQEKPQEKKPETDRSESAKLSDKDIIALSRAQIDDDDIDEVLRYAAFRTVSVADALKDSTLQSIIEDRKEKRASALAAQTKGGRGTSKVSGETLLERAASKGEVPESDEDIERMIDARLNHLGAGKKQ